MQLANIVIAFTALYVSVISAQVPIPSRPDGYGVGGPADANVVVEMFMDPLCPSCKGEWPTILQLIQAYGKQIHVRIHTFPLPYHTNSFLASQGLHVIANITNRNLDAIFQYATKVFENQQMWYNDVTQSMSMTQILDSLATFVDKTGLVVKAQFLAGMNDAYINDETRISWKYGCSRGVAGTPTFFVNGVFINASPSWSLADWKSVIDPILAANKKISSHVMGCPPSQKQCNYAPHKSECCLAGENCIPNVGCRCFNLKNGNRCA